VKQSPCTLCTLLNGQSALEQVTGPPAGQAI
jgi:hypothetical protein